MNKKSYSQILDQVARDGLQTTSDLTPRILARIQKGKRTTMQPRMKVFATAILVLLVLVIGLVSVPSVRAAIQRWIGYVPGMGLIGEGQIRTLAEPVSITRDGITLTVEQMWVDSERTFLQYSVEGRSPGMVDANSPGDGCLDPAILRLPDGELMISQPQAVNNWASGYALKSTYLAIPSHVDEVTLVMPCVLLSLPGKAPEHWEVTLHLVPAPPEAVFPVIEISTPGEARPTVPAQTNTALPTDGISLILDRAIPMDDGYLIYATIHYESTGPDWIDIPDPTMLHLQDASGKDVAYELELEATNAAQTNASPKQTSFAIKTAPLAIPGPLTLLLDTVSASLAADTSFTFDPGTDPKPGQTWELNQDLDIGQGHTLRILKATYDLTDGTQAYLRFEMDSETGVTYAFLFDKAHPLTGAGGGGGGSPLPGPFTTDLYYLEPLPKGPIIVTITGVSVNLPGHWETSWTPPETQTMPPLQASACLTRESWQRALQSRAALPAGLSGIVAISDVPPADYHYQVSITRLDGSDLKSIGFGSAPSLSPDGTKVVYMGPAIAGPADGLYITDITSGKTTHLPGTSRGDMNPLWSPDGQTIAFTRGPASGLIGAPGPYQIVVMSVDGSNIRQLTDPNEVNYAAGWMPDGTHLLYGVPSRDGVSLQIMDAQTGEVRALFSLNYNGTAAISPDGNRLAFEEMLPLDKYGLFVSNLDGSNRKLLADGDPYTVTVPSWSPDGNWLIASVHDPSTNTYPNPTLALIQVDTCELIPLPNLGGYVSSWVP